MVMKSKLTPKGLHQDDYLRAFVKDDQQTRCHFGPEGFCVKDVSVAGTRSADAKADKDRLEKELREHKDLEDELESSFSARNLVFVR